MPGMIQPTRQIAFKDNDPTSGVIIAVKVKSLFSNKTNTMSLPPISVEAWNRWQSGQHIQTALPHLTPDQREFLLTGATPAEWDAAFPEDDD